MDARPWDPPHDGSARKSLLRARRLQPVVGSWPPHSSAPSPSRLDFRRLGLQVRAPHPVAGLGRMLVATDWWRC